MLKLMMVGLILLTSACTSENPSFTTDIPKNAQEVTLAVSKMTCSTCGPTVRKALLQVNGVYNASVDTKTKMATVFFDAEKCDTKKLTTATNNAGYPSKLSSLELKTM